MKGVIVSNHQEITGFDWQDGRSDCGPTTLRHALLLLGDVKYKGIVKKLVNQDSDGTNALDFLKGIKKLGYSCPEINSADPNIVIRQIRGYLVCGCPVAISVDNNRHFVLVGSYHHAKGKYLVIDSYYDPFWSLMFGKDLLKRMVHDNEYFMGNAIVPQTPDQEKMSIVTSFANDHYKDLDKNDNLAENWGMILEDLIGSKSFHVPPRQLIGEKRDESCITSEIFFNTYQEEILEVIDNVQDISGFGKEKMKKLIGHYRYVANAYGFVIKNESVPIAAAEISSLMLIQKTCEEFVY